jgi:hypothetical protein
MNVVENALAQANAHMVDKGFVTFHLGDRKHDRQLLARGLYVPMVDRYQQVRSRVFFLETRAPKWFWDFARRCAETQSQERLFVRVCNTHSDTIAFVRPILGIERDAMQEWEAYQTAQEVKPRTLNGCGNEIEQFDLIARAVARQRTSTLLRCDGAINEAHLVTHRGRYLSIENIFTFLKEQQLDPDVDLLEGEHKELDAVRTQSMFATPQRRPPPHLGVFHGQTD